MVETELTELEYISILVDNARDFFLDTRRFSEAYIDTLIVRLKDCKLINIDTIHDTLIKYIKICKLSSRGQLNNHLDCIHTIRSNGLSQDNCGKLYDAICAIILYIGEFEATKIIMFNDRKIAAEMELVCELVDSLSAKFVFFNDTIEKDKDREFFCKNLVVSAIEDNNLIKSETIVDTLLKYCKDNEAMMKAQQTIIIHKRRRLVNDWFAAYGDLTYKLQNTKQYNITLYSIIFNIIYSAACIKSYMYLESCEVDDCES